jgi:hypothetical protein
VIAFPTTRPVPELLAAGANWVLKDCSQISIPESEPWLRLELMEG